MKQRSSLVRSTSLSAFHYHRRSKSPTKVPQPSKRLLKLHFSARISSSWMGLSEGHNHSMLGIDAQTKSSLPWPLRHHTIHLSVDMINHWCLVFRCSLIMQPCPFKAAFAEDTIFASEGRLSTLYASSTQSARCVVVMRAISSYACHILSKLCGHPVEDAFNDEGSLRRPPNSAPWQRQLRDRQDVCPTNQRSAKFNLILWQDQRLATVTNRSEYISMT